MLVIGGGTPGYPFSQSIQLLLETVAISTQALMKLRPELFRVMEHSQSFMEAVSIKRRDNVARQVGQSACSELSG